MAALGFLLSLAVCVLLGNMAGAINSAPCQLSRRNNAHSEFIRRHMREDAPKSLDQNEWQTYISNSDLCNRPTNSFLRYEDKDLVDSVCSAEGGRWYRGHLCISNQPFTFITVRNQGCKIVKETKHLILGCDLLGNRCLPVHFEKNPQSSTPAGYNIACQA